MKIYVAGNSHLTHYTKIGAAFRGLHVTNDSDDADLILIAEDTLTNGSGVRVLRPIETLVTEYCGLGKPVILMSQVPPGFCRNQNKDNLFHYPETLRIRDSYERACNPEYIIIGCPGTSVAPEVMEYAHAFNCRVQRGTYEQAEMAKIAVNTYLAMQVDFANRMQKILGNEWDMVAEMIKLDKRIGPHAYLTPGRWQDSLHLLRDYVTLKEIEDAS
jgi:UDPglucose 6-dehydrogenase